MVSQQNSSCARNLAQVVKHGHEWIGAVGNLNPRDVVFDSRCDVSTGKILAEALQRGVVGLGPTIELYMPSALQHLVKSYATMGVESKSDLFDSAMMLERPPEDEVVAHNLFVAGKFRQGFAYLRAHWVQSNFSFIDGDAGKLIHAGIEAGADGNYESAASFFKGAYAHARADYYLPEAIYLLGVARAADGKRELARETWRFGLPHFNRARNASGVGVNFLMLGQLLGRAIS